jgi:hypothetical protein
MKTAIALLSFTEVSLRRLKASAAVVLAMFFVFSVSVYAADGQGGRTRVSGDSVFSDCGEYALEMSGDLNGCLDIIPQRYTCEEVGDIAVYREWGEEFFRDEDGVSTFETKYDLEGIYTAGFCETFDFTTQLAGGCDHKVLKGRGKFRGANGIITFYDIIPDPGVSGASNFIYHGDVKYQD